MKKTLYYIFAIVLTLALSGCDDYLTQTPPDQLTSGNYWRNKADVESAMSSAYSQMYLMDYSSDMWTFAEVNWPVLGYRGDDVNMGNDAMNYQNWVDLYNFTYTNGNSQFTTYWTHMYTGISFCNQIIDKAGAMGEDKIAAGARDSLVAGPAFCAAITT